MYFKIVSCYPLIAAFKQFNFVHILYYREQSLGWCWIEVVKVPFYSTAQGIHLWNMLHVTAHTASEWMYRTCISLSICILQKKKSLSICIDYRAMLHLWETLAENIYIYGMRWRHTIGLDLFLPLFIGSWTTHSNSTSARIPQPIRILPYV
jgi:hypothetical protein